MPWATANRIRPLRVTHYFRRNLVVRSSYIWTLSNEPLWGFQSHVVLVLGLYILHVCQRNCAAFLCKGAQEAGTAICFVFWTLEHVLKADRKFEQSFYFFHGPVKYFEHVRPVSSQLWWCQSFTTLGMKKTIKETANLEMVYIISRSSPIQHGDVGWHWKGESSTCNSLNWNICWSRLQYCSISICWMHFSYSFPSQVVKNSSLFSPQVHTLKHSFY